MYRIITHDDLDGFASGYLVKEYLLNNGVSSKDIEVNIMNYEKTLNIEDYNKEDEIWITDFSLKPEVMNEVLDKVNKITWIDHHKSALEYLPNYSRKPEGVQLVGMSATALVYLYLYAPELLEKPIEEMEAWLSENAPKVINLTDAWDAWKEKSQYREESKLLSIAASPQLSFNLIKELHNEEKLKALLEKAPIYTEYRKAMEADFVDRYGFDMRLVINDEYSYSVFVINRGNTSSESFDSKLREYDICISYASNGQTNKVSVYSDKDYIDCSKICKAFGGGGHKGASGFNLQSFENVPGALIHPFKKDTLWNIEIPDWEG